MPTIETPSKPTNTSKLPQFCIGLVATCLVACSGASIRTPATVSPPTLEEVRNATVVGLFDEPVKLRDGRWEGEPYVAGGASRPTAGVIDDLWVAGDLDGDGIGETVAFLWSATGGSGTRNYIGVFARTGAGVESLSTVLIGDRVKLREARIVDGRIEVDVVEHGPGEAMCCPSVEATLAWSYDGRDLRGVPRPTG
jgi:hypothetical protein